MSTISDITKARLAKFQRGLNVDTMHNMAVRNIAMEDSLRHLVYCIEHGIPVDNDAVERAKALYES